ncbi:Mth938-like domain-containing protein [Pacificimonas sp. WHA3]|uniref:Mth938-like domain-containing protein n=1 Tax=Pacificimonas pallii TaxID=2827236 RepID=A0ABS6SEB3_9SPHN|nr:Mth938-like domain-containing protein [Pacificimonas pallii]MBV7256749.1 Mth938-like domain-containing protein [Pacificimonas pallii]
MAFEEIHGPEGAKRIEAVRGNMFVVGGDAQAGAFLIWPAAIVPADIPDLSALKLADFEAVLAIDPARDVLLIGSGARMAWPPLALLEQLRARGLGPEVMDSRAAARTYNLLVAEDRQVAALILPLI